MELSFTYDVVCPYAYVASTRIEALAARAGATLRWEPVLLGGIYRAHDGPQQPSAAMPPAKAALNVADMHRQAERAGAPFQFSPHHPQRTVEAMRLLVACPEADRAALTHRLYAMYWQEGVRFTRENLAAAAAEVGLDISVIDDPATRQALFDSTARAVSRGAFGVPTMHVGDEMFWGADRLPFVGRALGWQVDEPVAPPAAAPHRLAFFHDFSSPFSYLAAMRVRAMAQAAGAELELVPFLLGALFNEIGTPTIPIKTMNAAKQAWVAADLAAWAAHTGARFRWTPHFPLFTVTPLRVALVAPETTEAIYEAAWADGVDISDKQLLRGVLDGAGFDGSALLAATAAPAVKQQLKDNTARAIAAGACGAPTFVVDDRHVFWGQDRMDMVAAALRGWSPISG